MTDYSCEGFTEIEKRWLARGSFFPSSSSSFPFLFLLFLSLLGRVRQKGKKCWMAGGQELVTSCLIFVGRGRVRFRFIWLGPFFRLLPPRSPTVSAGKKRVIQGAWKRRWRTFACAPHKHTFLLVLTCIVKPLTRFSWKQIRYTCNRALAHINTNTRPERKMHKRHTL